MIFTEQETAYLAAQSLARMATVQPDGTLQVSPVGFTHNTELDTIDVVGHGMAGSRKFRNVAANGRVAIVIDDVASMAPPVIRCLEIRGTAEAVRGPGDPAAGDDGAVIRIRPRRIISFGINHQFDMKNLQTDNRDVN
ncbi:PPOX class F420-dependent oxidoreductase [Actinospica durhamensis]|uniref:PPOX class F420-dependent oxidoreductase n=1 Tax=Actinospica durhamensis TaxID=1508375 RepID=UPI001BA49414|nr:PPOX class F420-dependent oxidoreductase [Actinospica durhamensis]